MPSVEYGYTQPFIETETVEYTHPDTGETVTQTREREYVPIRIYTRKWTQTGANAYRLWLRVTVTEFGDTLSESGVPSNVTAPDWYGTMAADVATWTEAIYGGQLPTQVIQQSVEATTEVVNMESVGDDVHAVIDVESDSFPVVAELGAATASFDPDRGE